MDSELQECLFQRYPAIFSERTLGDTETAMCRGIEVGNGWFHLLDGLCSKLQWETDRERAPQVVATQVKEKLGTLRFYRHAASERQLGMIDLAVEMSSRICEICGAPAETLSVNGLLVTRCMTHRNAVDAPAG